MSMIGNFRMASDAEIQALLDDPDSVGPFLYPDSDEAREGATEMDVDKAWHGIHFLLCGHSFEGEPPLDFVVCGGTSVGDVDVGYGPARVFKSMEVAEIAQALAPITSVELRAKFKAQTFFDNEIYPEIWNEPVEDCLDNYVLSYFEELKAFVLKAGDEGKGLIVYLN